MLNILQIGNYNSPLWLKKLTLLILKGLSAQLLAPKDLATARLLFKSLERE
jgi:hypothetical protein